MKYKIFAMLLLVAAIFGTITVSQDVRAEEQNSSELKQQSNANAVNPIADACKHNPDAAICKTNQKSLSQSVGDIIKFVVSLLGIIAVIVIIIAGMTYVTSAGDAGKVVLAKRMIIYAVIGLIVAIASGAIVAFVVNQFGK